MNRELSEEEKRLTNKGIKRLTNELKDLKENFRVLKLHEEFRLKKRIYEDEIRPFNRLKEDKETEEYFKKIEIDIKMKENTLKNLKEQIKKGVEVKKNSLVE